MKDVRVPKKIIMDDIPMSFHDIKYDGRNTKLTYQVEYIVKGTDKVKFEKLAMKPYDVAKGCSVIDGNKPSNIVTQGKYECGPAAMAMLLNEPFYIVKKAFAKVGWNNNERGVTSDMDIKVARMFGRDIIETNRPTGKPCLITIPSLNLKDKWHAITWDGKQILDPNYGYEGRRFWTPDWAPWTIGATKFLVLLDYALSEAERQEIDEWQKYRDQLTIENVKLAIIKSIKDAA